MNVSLTPERERLVNEKVASGLYQTASEVVREALRLLKERDQAREQLRADVQAGVDQLARGEGRVYDKTSGRQLAERIKSRGRAARAKKS
jgi:antitoxin ParD1/3/4